MAVARASVRIQAGGGGGEHPSRSRRDIELYHEEKRKKEGEGEDDGKVQRKEIRCWLRPPGIPAALLKEKSTHRRDESDGKLPHSGCLFSFIKYFGAKESRSFFLCVSREILRLFPSLSPFLEATTTSSAYFNLVRWNRFFLFSFLGRPYQTHFPTYSVLK